MFNKSGFRFAGESITGLVRKHNEDSFLIAAPAGRSAALAAVADGVGGHRHGEIASYIICRDLGAAFAKVSDGQLQRDEDAEKFLCETVAAINRRIFAINLKEFSPHPMSTTLVALLFTPGRAIMLNVGDSRFYMASGGDHVAQISTDHTLANEKHLAPETLEDDPRALHALTRSIGTRYNLKFEIRTLALQGDERFLLCSDGVYRELSDRKIAAILTGADSPEATVNALMRSALLEGAHDNTSAISVFSC